MAERGLVQKNVNPMSNAMNQVTSTNRANVYVQREWIVLKWNKQWVVERGLVQNAKTSTQTRSANYGRPMETAKETNSGWRKIVTKVVDVVALGSLNAVTRIQIRNAANGLQVENAPLNGWENFVKRRVESVDLLFARISGAGNLTVQHGLNVATATRIQVG
ncbi:uncharacterized protein LOC106055715 [Biomphalaria glabrata]|uniref:Uncharacterized protein LOC106055715 n=1 Tax=Biomphalaria glabrata TaxID=6526 RepID=A0A9W2Z1J5_BIOGL|nr:uncharacterized protein LOC106055715 [Biomphalaria glabrata]